MRPFTFITLFLTFNTVCGSYNHHYSIFSKRFKQDHSTLDRLIRQTTGDNQAPEVLEEPPQTAEPVQLPPRHLGLDTLVDFVRGDRTTDPAIADACTAQLSERFVGDADDEAYVIRRSDAIGRDHVSLMVRKVVVRSPPATQPYIQKLTRVFQKIYIHKRLGNLVKWLRVDSRGTKTYYIIFSYEGDIVSPDRARDSITPLRTMREGYVAQLRENPGIDIDAGEQDFIYRRRDQPRRYDLVYA